MKDFPNDCLDKECEECIHNLAEAVAEQLHHEYASELEPFEHYIQRVRLHLYAGIGDFAKRLGHGYQLLVCEAKKEGRQHGGEQ